MKVAYPYKTTSLKHSFTSTNRFGIYPIGKFNAWHGGIHVEDDTPIKTIANGRVIAYRIPDEDFVEDLGKGNNNPKYSNGFVLMQHDYESPKSDEGTEASEGDETSESNETLKYTFYSLYHHLMSKEDYEKDDASKKKIPDVLAKFTYKISNNANNFIKGLEVYRLGADGNVDKTNIVFLTKGSTIEVLQEAGQNITVNTGKYWKIECTDYEGNTHNDVYASKRSTKENTVSYGGDKSPKKGLSFLKKLSLHLNN